MGLFQHRPEDPTEWAGLPSEPLDESAVERLPESAPAGLTGWTGLFDDGAATSVEVPLAGIDVPTSEDAAPAGDPTPTSAPPQTHH